MRRIYEEFKRGMVEQYFKDVDINKISNGKYDGFTLYNGKIYFTKFDEKELKFKRTFDYCGYAMALNLEQNYAGGSFLDVEDIIFEEFMSRKNYLKDEPKKLMSLYCTIDRKRGTTKCWLVGNTISRVCPYLEEWGLHNIVAKQKQGQIKTVEIEQEMYEETEKIGIAIEYCISTGVSSHTIGSSAGMLNNGEWQVDNQPLFKQKKKDFNIYYRIFFEYKGFRFIGEYLVNKKNPMERIWFIYPKYTEIYGRVIVFSDNVKENIFWQKDIYNLTFKNKMLQKIFNEFRESTIFFSDNLTGTDFKQAIDFNIKK